jgi:hypothetical protein
MIEEDFKVNRIDGDDDRKGGGSTEDTPMWISAFAINLNNREDAIKDDPSESGFAKAMSSVADCQRLPHSISSRSRWFPFVVTESSSSRRFAFPLCGDRIKPKIRIIIIIIHHHFNLTIIMYDRVL